MQAARCIRSRGFWILACELGWMARGTVVLFCSSSSMDRAAVSVGSITWDCRWRPNPSPCVSNNAQVLHDGPYPYRTMCGMDKCRHQARTAMAARWLVRRLSRAVPLPHFPAASGVGIDKPPTSCIEYPCTEPKGLRSRS